MIPQTLQDHLANQLSTTLQTCNPLGGGCIHNAYIVKTPKDNYFVKWNDLDSLDNFEVERKGLELLASTATVKIPAVIQTGKHEAYAYLVLEFIETGRRASDFWEQFGRNLAMLHQHTQAQHGLSYDNYIGSLPQINPLSRNWIDFFCDARIRPMLKRARDKQLVDKSLVENIEKVLSQAANYFPDEPPSLLHGDLWGGNIMVGSDGHAVIFDPAVYYGHREMELAFMTLFDRQPEPFYNSYQEVWPLVQGWQDRLDLYNLYPLLVHVVLFGRGYASGVKSVVRKYG